MSIRIDDLTVTFKNGVTAVDHVDLEIPHGIFGLLGENGAGKTTLMRVLTTVLAPTKWKSSVRWYAILRSKLRKDTEKDWVSATGN